MNRILFMALTVFALYGCDRRQPEGPAERAGKKIDNASDEIHDSAVRTKENAKSMGREVRDQATPSDETVERTKENAREIGRDLSRRTGTND